MNTDFQQLIEPYARQRAQLEIQTQKINDFFGRRDFKQPNLEINQFFSNQKSVGGEQLNSQYKFFNKFVSLLKQLPQEVQEDMYITMRDIFSVKSDNAGYELFARFILINEVLKTFKEEHGIDRDYTVDDSMRIKTSQDLKEILNRFGVDHLSHESILNYLEANPHLMDATFNGSLIDMFVIDLCISGRRGMNLEWYIQSFYPILLKQFKRILEKHPTLFWDSLKDQDNFDDPVNPETIEGPFSIFSGLCQFDSTRFFERVGRRDGLGLLQRYWENDNNPIIGLFDHTEQLMFSVRVFVLFPIIMQMCPSLCIDLSFDLLNLFGGDLELIQPYLTEALVKSCEISDFIIGESTQSFNSYLNNDAWLQPEIMSKILTAYFGGLGSFSGKVILIRRFVPRLLTILCKMENQAGEAVIDPLYGETIIQVMDKECVKFGGIKVEIIDDRLDLTDLAGFAKSFLN